MAKYIRAVEAAEKVEGTFKIPMADLVDIFAEIPAADVPPVVHGQWIPFHSEIAGDIQYCSACEIGLAAKTDYCPHCGAKMDGGADHEAD